MSVGAILSFAAGILGPLALAAACVFEAVSKKRAKSPRGGDRAEKLRGYADIGLVAAWILLAAAYLLFRYISPDAAVWEAAFERWMTWMLGALLVLDVVYLFLRRSRPREPGTKKNFWEI